MSRLRLLAAALLAACVVSGPCRAWGTEGHRVVALIAEYYLTPATRQRVAAALAVDAGLTPAVPRDIAGAAAWADRYRDSDRNAAGLRYRQTFRWHFVNLDLHRPDLRAACFGHPPLAAGQLPSRGPGRACIVDKIEQFRAQWQAPDTDPAERQLALLFLLHLVADLHQPLHASDNDDEGGNRIDVAAPGLKKGSLHRFWDTAAVRHLDPAAARLAPRLIDGIDAAQRAEWRRGGVADWALEAHALAVRSAYGGLPAAQRDAAGRELRRLSQSYVDEAGAVVALQLRRAGVRLAMLLEPPAR